MDIFAYFGILATLWIFVGVTIAASNYNGYSHSQQFLSELGASGSPTEKLSPVINNYPLGMLFCLFGLYISLRGYSDSNIILTLGLLIIMHGVGTWIAGFFPMDPDPYAKKQTLKSKIHWLAGITMNFSLMGAMIAVFFDSFFNSTFKIFTIFMSVVWMVFSITLISAVIKRHNNGLHQRLGYGAQLIWLSGLSFYLSVMT